MAAPTTPPKKQGKEPPKPKCTAEDTICPVLSDQSPFYLHDLGVFTIGLPFRICPISGQHSVIMDPAFSCIAHAENRTVRQKAVSRSIIACCKRQARKYPLYQNSSSSGYSKRANASK